MNKDAVTSSQPQTTEKMIISEKRNLPVFLLCFFLGMVGVHRFYVGKIGTGLLQLLTLGGVGLWAVIDLIVILCGGFTDKEGNRIALWVDEPEGQPGEGIEPRYAGFWRRFVALIIDFVLIHIFVFPIVVVIGLVAPQHILVSVPFDLFTTERTIGTEQTEQKHPDRSTTEIDASLIEVTCLGKWQYLYRETIEYSDEAEDTYTSRQLLDSTTKQEMNLTTVDDIVLLVIFIYWILMDGSRYQASLGKMALRLRVVDAKGHRLSVPRALGRNLLKFLSSLTSMIGFMLAGWTKRKQTLHDMITGCYVMVDD
jgi:uncharacterized RDD family membrane protein YckC/TM2 domain-containing membrane protein YozV